MDPDPAGYSSLLALLQHIPGIVFDPALLAVQVVILLLLLVASALFSGSEVALFSLDLSTRSALAQAGDQASALVLTFLEHPRPLYVTILLLNTVVNVFAAILTGVIVAGVGESFGWSPRWTVLTGIVAMTFVLVVVIGITPKLIASRNAPSFIRRVSGFILAAHRFLSPVSTRVAQVMNAVPRRLKAAANDRLPAASPKVDHGPDEADGNPDEEDRDLIHSVVEFSETTVREVMTSRLDIVALPASATMEEALDLIRTSGHSRLPLYEEHLDNILGIVYAKDLLPYLAPHSGSETPPKVDWSEIARPPMFVPLGKYLEDLLKDFQKQKMHIAIVVDEYGGTAGLVTMEDVLEEIVGDIRDEHDEQEEALYERIDPDTYRFDARIDLDDLNNILGTNLDTEDFDFETLGGLIFHLTGSIPVPGDEVTYESLHMRVESVEAHRIGRVLVRRGLAGEIEELSEENVTDEQ